MGNILDKIKKYISAWHKQFVERAEAKRKAQLEAEVNEAVQVREFNGELYVSIHGAPLLGVGDIKGTLTEAVAHCREIYKSYLEGSAWKRNATTHSSTR